MSVKVSLSELAHEVPRWSFGYLVTVSEDSLPHVIALQPAVAVSADGVCHLRFDAEGRRACRNAADRPQVTVVFPPLAGGDGYSLIIEGTATVDGDVVDLAPTGAVLHRPAPDLAG